MCPPLLRELQRTRYGLFNLPPQAAKISQGILQFLMFLAMISLQQQLVKAMLNGKIGSFDFLGNQGKIKFHQRASIQFDPVLRSFANHEKVLRSGENCKPNHQENIEADGKRRFGNEPN